MLGEISRNDVGILRKSNCFLIMKNKTEEMTSNPPEVNIDFNNEKQKECWGKSLEIVSASLRKLILILIMKNKTEQETVEEMLGKISRLSPQSINRIGVWCLDLLRNRLELSLKELNKKD